jgi:ribosomal-protein-alanine N-acetyltransferase
MTASRDQRADMASPQIRTERLTLRPFTPEAIEAMLSGDALHLAAVTTAAFPQPLSPPPLMEDVFPMIRQRLLEDPSQEGWWAWVVIRRDTGQAVGSVGFGGPPDEAGAVVMGYATYPGFEGSGFASEAAAGLLQWAMTQPAVKRVAATIPPWNEKSIRVAEKIGMHRVGAIWDEEVGDVYLFAADRKG